MKKLTIRYASGCPLWVLYMWGAMGVAPHIFAACGVCKEEPGMFLITAAFFCWVFYLLPHQIELMVENEHICVTHRYPWKMHRTRRVKYESDDVINFEVAYSVPGLFTSFTNASIDGKVCLRRGTKRLKIVSNNMSRAEFGRVVAYLREQTGLADHTCFAPAPGAAQKLSGEENVSS